MVGVENFLPHLHCMFNVMKQTTKKYPNVTKLASARSKLCDIKEKKIIEKIVVKSETPARVLL
jgi:hypothetical protein